MTLINQQFQSQISDITPLATDRVDDSSVVNSSSAEAVVWYYSNSGVWGAASGQAAGTMCYAKLTYTGVLNALGSAIGNYYDTSLSFAAATRASTLVNVPEEAFSKMESMSVTNKVAYIATWLDTNGDYAIDHRRGAVWLKTKADPTNDAATYKYATTITGGGTGDKVDVIKVGGVAVPTAGADAASNTRSNVPVSSILSGFNGTTWDRLRAGIKTVTATLTGWLNTLPWAIYNATPTTRTEGQGGPFQSANNGSVKTRVDGYDTATDSNKSFEVSPIDSHYVNGFIDVDTTNVGAGPTYYPSSAGITMDGKKSFSFSGKLIEGDAEDNTLTVQVMNDEDTTSGTWQTIYFFDNISNTWVNSYGCNATTTNMAASLDNLNFRYLRVKFIGGGSATNTIECKGRCVPL